VRADNGKDGAMKIEDLYSKLRAAGMGPGWNKPEPSLWSAPRENFLPAHWSYATAKAALDEAGSLVSTELAERRNLILFNPIEGNNYATVRTLVSAYQMVMPGEAARSHRHTPNALRLVVDAAPGNYTVVNGKKLPMLPGDVLLTPNWAWHGHCNESSERGYWIDFLDVPMVHFLEPMFFEPLPGGGIEEAREVEEGSAMRFPFAVIKERLSSQKTFELGPPTLDTVSLHVRRLTRGESFEAGRSTANSIFAVIQGEGSSTIGGSVFRWKRGDVLAAPAWREYRHQADAESYLLRVTDEPLMRRLNWYREDG
jgi:gentisate 1,2-dioxygenase